VSAQPARHLRVVGESVIDEGGFVLSPADLHEELERLRVDLKMAQRDVRAKNRLIAELERDKVRERVEYERRAEVERIATYWHRKCRPNDYKLASPRINPMSPERFDAVRGILDQEHLVRVEGKKRPVREPMYTLAECKAAIDGAAFDHFVKTRKNGSEKHHDDLEFIFRNSVNFEECRDRCPRPPADV
jgi:hypothetical protein